MRIYGDPWRPMGTMGAYEGLWGPMETHGELCGPMGVNVDP